MQRLATALELEYEQETQRQAHAAAAQEAEGRVQALQGELRALREEAVARTASISTLEEQLAAATAGMHAQPAEAASREAELERRLGKSEAELQLLRASHAALVRHYPHGVVPSLSACPPRVCRRRSMRASSPTT